MPLTPSLRCPSLCLSLLVVAAACGPKTEPLDSGSSGESGDPSGDPSGGSGGDPTTTSGGNNSGTATGGGVDHAICDQYLACIAAVNPDALPGSQASFGPAGSCWSSTPAIAQQCLTSCMNGLASLALQFPGEPACGGNGSDTEGTATSGMTDFTTGITVTATVTTEPPDTTTGVCNDPPNQPIDSACTDASGCGCDTGVCWVVPALGGFCSECLRDDDCPGGCTAPNPIAGVGARCNAGGFGDGCEADVTCVDPNASQCSLVIEVPGIITVRTCGQCDDNDQCLDPGAPICAPDYDLAGFTGVNTCKPAGSVPNDGGCDLETGEAVCASGHCGEANVMGLLKFGVCGACSSDSDCQFGETCSEPQADLDNEVLIGASCI